jgi:hypothetical protein
MYRPETKIGKEADIICNKSSQQTKSMNTNAEPFSI